MLEQRKAEPFDFILRHVGGDFGALDADDMAVNGAALKRGNRILSSCPFGSDKKLWPHYRGRPYRDHLVVTRRVVTPEWPEMSPPFRARLGQWRTLRKGGWVAASTLTTRLILLAGTADTPTPNIFVWCRCVGCASENHQCAFEKMQLRGSRLIDVLARTNRETCPKDREWTEKPASGLDEKRRCCALRQAHARTLPGLACPKVTLCQGLVRRGLVSTKK